MATKEIKINIDYGDAMSTINFVEDLDKILKEYGISLEIEEEDHDGYDVCIVKINEK